MPSSSRIRIRKESGAFVAQISLQGDATFSFDAAEHNGLPGDPGPFIAFEAFNFPDQQSAKMRQVQIGPKDILISSDYGDQDKYDLWLTVHSNTPEVAFHVVKKLRDYDVAGALSIASGVGTANSPAADLDNSYQLGLW